MNKIMKYKKVIHAIPLFKPSYLSYNISQESIKHIYHLKIRTII
jgi:hypothetical protein